MQFYEPQWLLLLWTIPLLVALFLFARRRWRGRLKRIGNLKTVEGKLMSDYRPSEWRKRAAYLILVFILSTLALARPQWGDEKKKIQR